MTISKTKQSKTVKLNRLLEVLTSLTGLGLDDILKEIEGTDQEKAKAQMENIIKMSEHMKINHETL